MVGKSENLCPVAAGSALEQRVADKHRVFAIVETDAARRVPRSVEHLEARPADGEHVPILEVDVPSLVWIDLFPKLLVVGMQSYRRVQLGLKLMEER